MILDLAVINFYLQPTKEIILPRFKEGAFRGAFGQVFRQMVCSNPNTKKCSECILNSKCAFSVIFAPSSRLDDQLFRNQDIPRPFTIQILDDIDSLLKVRLLMVGSAIEYFPYIFLTIQEMGRQGIGIGRKEPPTGQYSFKKITEQTLETEKAIFHEGKNSYTPIQGFKVEITESINNYNHCTVKLLSPVRLKKDKKIAQFIDFPLLIRSVTTRINAFSYFYGNGSLDDSFPALLELAKDVAVKRCNTEFVDYRWKSVNQKQAILLGGLIGEIDYTGNLDPFLSYLKIAEIIGVGKNSTFGFGKISCNFS